MMQLIPQVTLALIDAAKTLLLALGLIWYAQHRRYAKERSTATLPAMVGYYIVEIGLVCAIVPSIASIAKLLTP